MLTGWYDRQVRDRTRTEDFEKVSKIVQGCGFTRERVLACRLFMEEDMEEEDEVEGESETKKGKNGRRGKVNKYRGNQWQCYGRGTLARILRAFNVKAKSDLFW